MALIDDFIAEPHYREHHSLIVSASTNSTLVAAARYRTETDPFFQRMIRVRELPMRLLKRIRSGERAADPPFGIDDFTLIARNDAEIVYGLVGRFWRTDFGLVHFGDATDFRMLAEPGVAKLAFNFRVEPRGEESALSTETRVVCSDRAARLAFAPYWYAIRPVSGLIRRRILASIRDVAECPTRGPLSASETR